LFRFIPSTIQNKWRWMMKKKWSYVSIFTGVLLVAVSLGVSQVQGSKAYVPSMAGSNVNGSVPIQGRLTNPSGSPLNGTYDITARLYDSATDGTLLCGNTYSVTVSNGLFNTTIDNCSASNISGAQLYLGIQVGADPEMTPRQPIYPVPYAWSLRPGAIISNTASSGHGLEVLGAGSGIYGSALWVENSNAGGIAQWVTNSSATSTDASLVIGNAGTGPLLKGFGGDGGNEDFSVNNDGSIKSRADSYIFVPGTEATSSYNYPELKLGYYLNWVYVQSPTSGEKWIQIGVTLPAVLFGQPVTVEEVTVYYDTSNSRSYIDGTYVYVQKSTYDFGGFYTIGGEETNHDSTTHLSTYSVPCNTYNTLSADQGFISVAIQLNYGVANDIITINGVRIRLGHGLN
jgi:hypothetical protein